MAVTWDWPGAKWWRVDLHAHSPKSYDFKTQAAQQDGCWQRWIEAARDAGVHAIAVTDHNTAEAVGCLQRAASSVTNSPVVFPGVELTANDGSHLLLLMDPSASETHVASLLSQVGIAVDQQGSQEARSSLSIEQILDQCGDETLIIGAHVNSAHGLLQHCGQQRIAELRHPRLAAVEINPDEAIDGSWLDGSKAEIGRILSEVWASDGHTFDRLGQRFTWVKMTKPNLEGLRLALLDGKSSLEPAGAGNTRDPNEHALLAIEEISVRDAKLMGRQSPVVIRFNPWFNAIIGSRGTGKSTLVDFCRKTLRREGELASTDSSEEGSLHDLFNRRMRVPGSRTEGGLLTSTTSIKMVYRKDGARFLLTWDQEGVDQPISRLDGDRPTPEEGNISERFPVRIYSQKQLFALAQDPKALLNVIDDTRDVRKAECERRIKRLETTYLSMCAEARVASAAAGELPARKAELRDVQHKLDVLAQQGHAQTLNLYRVRRQVDDTWNSILKEVEQGLKSARISASDLAVADLELGAEAEDDAPRAALRRAHQSLNQVVGNLSQDLQACIAAAESQMMEVRTGINAIAWQKAVESTATEYRQTASRLVQEGLTDPTEYELLLDRKASLETEIKGLENELVKAQTLQEQTSDTLAEYRRERYQLSTRRQAFVSEVSSDRLRVQVIPLADHAQLADNLIDILGVARFERDRTAMVDRIQPEEGTQWDWDRLDGVIDRLRGFHSGTEVSWQAIDGRFAQALGKVPPERVDRLALYMPSDEVQISFKDFRPGSSWRPLSQGSPGQQAAALLAFVLGFGDEPLILDQPEDDLDNTLIYDLLVSRFRDTKRTRQMIVVTHNPNLVVHGDAECVVSLGAQRDGQTTILQQGGLQERAVRDEICHVMEGGREAFETRFHRIVLPRGAGS